MSRWLDIICIQDELKLSKHRAEWCEESKTSLIMPIRNLPEPFIFTAAEGSKCVFSFTCILHHSMPETIEHRLLRSRKVHAMNHQLPERSQVCYYLIYTML